MRRTVLALLAAYLAATHLPPLLYATYILYSPPPPGPHCKLLIVVGAGGEGVVKDVVLPAGACIATLTLDAVPKLRGVEAEVAIVVAHGDDGYVATATPATPLNLYLSTILFETGAAAVMDTNDGGFVALEWSLVKGFLNARRVYLVSCFHPPDTVALDERGLRRLLSVLSTRP